MSDLAPEKLSTSDFKSILNASYMPQKKAEELMATKGYGYDKELSTMAHKVFVSPTGKPIISNRGSVTAKDWLYEDVNAGLGGIFGKTEKVKNVQQLAKATQDKYGMAPTVTGHSLGGYLAEKGARKGSDVYTYNKAAGISAPFTKRNENQTDYRTTFDLPSAFSAYQGGGSSKTLAGSWNPILSHNIKYLK